VAIAAVVAGLAYGGSLLLHQSRTRALDLCILTDFEYRAERSDWEPSVKSTFDQINAWFAKAGVSWRLRFGGEAYPPKTPGSPAERLVDIERTASCKADVVLVLSGRRDLKNNAVVYPFSHALLVNVTAAESTSMTAANIARALANLFGAPTTAQAAIQTDVQDGIFNAGTLQLIGAMRDYDFAHGVSGLSKRWEERAVGAIAAAVSDKGLSPVAEAHRILGRAYAGSLQYDGATRQLREAVRIDPRNGDLHFELAMNLEAASESEEALKELRAAAELDQESGWPYAAMGSIYLSSARIDQAIEAFRAAAARDPRNAGFQAALGQALSEQPGHTQEAAAAFAAAVRLKPSESGAQSGLLHELDEEKRAQEFMWRSETAATQKPGSARTHMKLGLAYAYSGNLSRAEDEIRHAVALEPSNELAHLALARTLYLEARYTEADAELKVARSHGATVPSALAAALDRKLGR
jgi:tetratricopeptide (TPR) repeat protein